MCIKPESVCGSVTSRYIFTAVRCCQVDKAILVVPYFRTVYQLVYTCLYTEWCNIASVIVIPMQIPVMCSIQIKVKNRPWVFLYNFFVNCLSSVFYLHFTAISHSCSLNQY